VPLKADRLASLLAMGPLTVARDLPSALLLTWRGIGTHRQERLSTAVPQPSRHVLGRHTGCLEPAATEGIGDPRQDPLCLAL
jgi:hypothetical protein